jgi:hypothetical protein
MRMGGFVEAALSFPAVLFTPLLLVIVGYWLFVAVGGAEPDSGGPDSDGGSGAAGDGALAVVGLGGVPVGIVLSLFAAFAWFASLAGTQQTVIPGPLVLLAALVAAWLLTRLAVLMLRRFLPSGAEPTRADFVGITCVIRTGRVTRTFGQAEVHAPDGSSAVVQVRQAGTDDLRAGTSAVLYDFDPAGEFFWVVPADVALHPDPPR